MYVAGGGVRNVSISEHSVCVQKGIEMRKMIIFTILLTFTTIALITNLPIPKLLIITINVCSYKVSETYFYNFAVILSVPGAFLGI